MDYRNLHNKTVFDFCEDEKVLAEVVPDYFLHGRKDEYIRCCKATPPMFNINSLLDLAEITHNQELRREVLEQFKEEIELFDE